MGQAKRRALHMENIASAPVSETGLHLLSRQAGVSVILIAKPAPQGTVDAAVFCIDDWQEGLFQCMGRHFDAVSPFQQEIATNGFAFRPTESCEAARRIAWSIAIQSKAALPLPDNFEHWKHLAGTLPNLSPEEAAYGCPVCENRLPPEMQKTILESAGKKVGCYIVCMDCIRMNVPRLSATNAYMSHRVRMDEFRKMESFSLNPG